ncbi:MAG: glycerol acyltransferase [Bacteroidales bacterium]|jgi:putative hemolysin|nr:glycerol acyltransferase [Bacteroidales bacterium]
MISQEDINFVEGSTVPKTVDLKKFIASKNPKLAKFMPKFVYNWLNRLLHVDEVNELLHVNRDYQGVDFATQIVKSFNPDLTVVGSEHITTDGRFFVAANHPLGGLDGVALISTVGQIRPDVLFPVNDILTLLVNLQPVFVGINKFGGNSSNTKNLTDAFAGENLILFFPAGLCSRRQKKGEIRDLDWKSTVITQARKNQRDIIPTYIKAYNSKRFYNWAYWRKKLGIKVNIEQLFLVDEMFNFNEKPIKIIFGNPIPYSTFDKRFNDKKWADLLKQHVYDLKSDPEKMFEF